MNVETVQPGPFAAPGHRHDLWHRERGRRTLTMWLRHPLVGIPMTTTAPGTCRVVTVRQRRAIADSACLRPQVYLPVSELIERSCRNFLALWDFEFPEPCGTLREPSGVLGCKKAHRHLSCSWRSLRDSRKGLHFNCFANTIVIVSWVARSHGESTTPSSRMTLTNMLLVFKRWRNTTDAPSPLRPSASPDSKSRPTDSSGPGTRDSSKRYRVPSSMKKYGLRVLLESMISSRQPEFSGRPQSHVATLHIGMERSVQAQLVRLEVP